MATFRCYAQPDQVWAVLRDACRQLNLRFHALSVTSARISIRTRFLPTLISVETTPSVIPHATEVSLSAPIPTLLTCLLATIMVIIPMLLLATTALEILPDTSSWEFGLMVLGVLLLLISGLGITGIHFRTQSARIREITAILCQQIHVIQLDYFRETPKLLSGRNLFYTMSVSTIAIVTAITYIFNTLLALPLLYLLGLTVGVMLTHGSLQHNWRQPYIISHIAWTLWCSAVAFSLFTFMLYLSVFQPRILSPHMYAFSQRAPHSLMVTYALSTLLDTISQVNDPRGDAQVFLDDINQHTSFLRRRVKAPFFQYGRYKKVELLVTLLPLMLLSVLTFMVLLFYCSLRRTVDELSLLPARLPLSPTRRADKELRDWKHRTPVLFFILLSSLSHLLAVLITLEASYFLGTGRFLFVPHVGFLLAVFHQNTIYHLGNALGLTFLLMLVALLCLPGGVLLSLTAFRLATHVRESWRLFLLSRKCRVSLVSSHSERLRLICRTHRSRSPVITTDTSSPIPIWSTRSMILGTPFVIIHPHILAALNKQQLLALLLHECYHIIYTLPRIRFLRVCSFFLFYPFHSLLVFHDFCRDEYKADAFAARMMNTAKPLRDALVKLSAIAIPGPRRSCIRTLKDDEESLWRSGRQALLSLFDNRIDFALYPSLHERLLWLQDYADET